jgi:hypothetical protein
MYPNSVADTTSFTDANWQKAKSVIDKATKTGLGAEFTKLQAAYAKVKPALMKLDAKMVGKLRDEDAINEAKKQAVAVRDGSDVKAFIAVVNTTATKADAVAKLKLSSAAKTFAQNAATKLKKIKSDIEGETFADFDDLVEHQKKLYAAQRSDFKDSVKKLMAAIDKLEKAPTLQTCAGTEFSGAYRGVQNKIGNLPEFKGVFEDKFDGLWPSKANLDKKPPEEVKKALLNHARESRLYVQKILQRAKDAGY